MVENDYRHVHLVELVDIGCSEIRYDDAVRLGRTDHVHVVVVQRGEQGDSELLARTEQGLGDDRRGGDSVGIEVREHLYEVVAADQVRGL